jgi:hypothetical protein
MLDRFPSTNDARTGPFCVPRVRHFRLSRAPDGGLQVSALRHFEGTVVVGYIGHQMVTKAARQRS